MEQGSEKSLDGFLRLEVIKLSVELVLKMLINDEPEAPPPDGGEPQPDKAVRVGA
jgi:hypothetical protein